MKHLIRAGVVLTMIALAFADDTEREKLEKAKKRSGATARVRHLLPLTGAKDEQVAAEAEALIAQIPEKDKLDILTSIMRNGSYEDRGRAARFLKGCTSEESIKALARTVLKDNIEDVRKAALAALKDNVPQNDLIAIFNNAFWLRDMVSRVRAAEAIGQIGEGNGSAVEYLIKELYITWGSTQRVNVLFATQFAYVKDYDIEIAQQAVIADPVVGTVSSGIALDVTVTRIQERMIVIERKVIGEALKNLTGQGLGENPKAWAKWWAENKDHFADK